MNIHIELTPAEAQRAVYEYLVRRGHPPRIKVERVAAVVGHAADVSVMIALEPCAQCENTTVIDGIGNRTTDCACAGRSEA